MVYIITGVYGFFGGFLSQKYYACKYNLGWKIDSTTLLWWYFWPIMLYKEFKKGKGEIL